MKDRSFQEVVFRFYYGSFSIIISYHKEKSRISLNLQGLLTLCIFFLDSKAKMVVVSMALTPDQDRASNYPGPVELLRANCY